MRPLVLVGYRGTGKTSLGKRVATLLNYPFLDTDALVVERAGRSIPEIFLDGGEAAFRELEAEALEASLSSKERPPVIATGGGIILRAENRERLAGCAVVWLQTDIPVILARTGGDPNRPSLTGLSPLEEIEQLVAARSPLYAEVSSYRVDTTTQPFSHIAREITDWFLGIGQR